jgi:hypothetical protein
MLKRENEEQHDHSNKQKKIKKEDAIGNLFFKNMLVIILV